MQNIPKELLVELLKYSGLISYEYPEIEFFVVKNEGSEFHEINIRLISGIEMYEFAITQMWDGVVREVFEKIIRDAISLKFNLSGACIHGNRLFLYPVGDTRSYALPLDKYGETISSQFKKIAEEYNIQQNVDSKEELPAHRGGRDFARIDKAFEFLKTLNDEHPLS
jgi:hypothetical protein